MSDADFAREHLVRFLAAMKDWNDWSFENCKVESAYDESRQRFQRVVDDFCTSRDVSCTGLSYSSPSEWDPGETIESIEQRGPDEIHVLSQGGPPRNQRNRYVLLRTPEGWRVDAAFAIFDSGDIAGLIAPELARRSEALWKMYERFALGSFLKQKQILKLVGESGWSFDKATSTLSFTNGLAWKVQVLGTEAEDSFTWLWSWANEASKLPPESIAAARKLREYGQKHGIRHFVEPNLPLGEADGEFYVLVAGGLTKSRGYYRAPYRGGAMFVLLSDPSIPEVPAEELTRFEEEYQRSLVSQGMKPSRRALSNFLRDQADLLLADDQAAEGAATDLENEPGVEVERDELGRVTAVRSTVTQESTGVIGKIFGWLGRLSR